MMYGYVMIMAAGLSVVTVAAQDARGEGRSPGEPRAYHYRPSHSRAPTDLAARPRAGPPSPVLQRSPFFMLPARSGKTYPGAYPAAYPGAYPGGYPGQGATPGEDPAYFGEKNSEPEVEQIMRPNIHDVIKVLDLESPLFLRSCKITAISEVIHTEDCQGGESCNVGPVVMMTGGVETEYMLCTGGLNTLLESSCHMTSSAHPDLTCTTGCLGDYHVCATDAVAMVTRPDTNITLSFCRRGAPHGEQCQLPRYLLAEEEKRPSRPAGDKLEDKSPHQRELLGKGGHGIYHHGDAPADGEAAEERPWDGKVRRADEVARHGRPGDQP